MDHLKMYGELAPWWHLLSSPADYAEDAAFYRERLEEASAQPIREILELGSGGGNNALHLKQHYQMTLVDLSPQMLSESGRLNPECEHVVGDMRTIRLGRLFDAVFVHDAICYMTTEADLRACFETAYAHTRPGGVALFAPDFLRETFVAETEMGGEDGADGRALRYLAWMWDPDPSDATYTVDYAYLFRDADGVTRAAHDRHLEGLFPRRTWLDLLRKVGFEPEIAPFEHSQVDGTLEVFVCRRAG